MNRQGMRHRVAEGILLIGSMGLTGSAAALASPPPLTSIVGFIGRPDLDDAGLLSSAQLRDGLKKALAGKVVRATDMPFVSAVDDCAEAVGAPARILCRWWLWEDRADGAVGFPRALKGFQVTIFTNPRHVFERVEVSEVQYVEGSVTKADAPRRWRLR